MQKILVCVFCRGSGMPFTGGERPVGEHSTAGSALVHHRTTQTCHSRGAKRRGNLAEPGWIAGYSRRKRDRLREIATSAYGLLAMTSRGASTVLTAAGTDRGGPSRDCHVGLRPPRNDKSGGQHCFNGGRYGSGGAFPRLHPKGTSSRFALRAPRARSALAMTNS